MPVRKNLWKRAAKVVLGFGALYFCLSPLPKFCYRQTGHFWIQTILSTRPFDSRWHAPLPRHSALEAINARLNQPYHFLGGGMQSFVFISEDQTTILKCFKHRKSILKKGRFIPHTPFLDSIFESYHIANTSLSQETGTFYIHLNRTLPIHPPLTLIDRLGIAYAIDLNETEFILQERATLIRPQLTQWMEQHDIDQAKKGVRSLISAFRSIYSKGFRSTDRAFVRNVGFIEGKAALIDAGSLVVDPSMQNPQIAYREFLQQGLHLENWLKRHYHELYEYYLFEAANQFRVTL